MREHDLKKVSSLLDERDDIRAAVRSMEKPGVYAQMDISLPSVPDMTFGCNDPMWDVVLKALKSKLSDLQSELIGLGVKLEPYEGVEAE